MTRKPHITQRTHETKEWKRGRGVHRAPRGPRVTPTALASFSTPDWRDDLELWSKAMSLAMDRTTSCRCPSCPRLWLTLPLRLSCFTKKKISDNTKTKPNERNFLPKSACPKLKVSECPKTWRGDERMEAAEMALAEAISQADGGLHWECEREGGGQRIRVRRGMRTSEGRGGRRVFWGTEPSVCFLEDSRTGFVV